VFCGSGIFSTSNRIWVEPNHTTKSLVFFSLLVLYSIPLTQIYLSRIANAEEEQEEEIMICEERPSSALEPEPTKPKKAAPPAQEEDGVVLIE
jgi:hypothetical protein